MIPFYITLGSTWKGHLIAVRSFEMAPWLKFYGAVRLTLG